MRIDKAREVQDLAQDVVRLIDAAVAAAYRDQDAANQHYMDRGMEPIVSPTHVAYTKEASALRRRSLDLTRALAEMRRPQ